MLPPIIYKAPLPPLQIRSVPRFGEVYWCNFSISNHLPEFDAEHPAVIVRSGQKLDACHIVIPLTSVDHEGDVYAVKLSSNPIPQKHPKQSWAVCNHLYTVASERLRPITNPKKFGDPVYPKLTEGDLRAIGGKVAKALTRILTASLPPQEPSS